VLFSRRAQVSAAGQNSEISSRDYRPAFNAFSDFRFSLSSSSSDPDRHISTAYKFAAIATEHSASYLITASSFTRSISFFKSSFY